MRKLHVTFDEIIYEPTKPADRERLVGDLVWKAYGLWLSSEKIVDQLRATIRAVYALGDSVPLADAEHNMVYPMVGFEKGFEAALADCQEDIGKRLDWTDPVILEACKSYWEVGKGYYDDFVTRYRPYFEEAVAADLYAPNYAFNQACMAAGLPLEEWVDQFGLSELGYYEEGE
jgi:hypothetical protein